MDGGVRGLNGKKSNQPFLRTIFDSGKPAVNGLGPRPACALRSIVFEASPSPERADCQNAYAHMSTSNSRNRSVRRDTGEKIAPYDAIKSAKHTHLHPFITMLSDGLCCVSVVCSLRYLDAIRVRCVATPFFSDQANAAR